jgi:hypothetical protein
LEFGGWIHFLAILPKDFDQQFLDGTLTKYDGAVSFSSLEHAGVVIYMDSFMISQIGLGRYGDILNPYADVIAISKIWYFLFFRIQN